MKKLFIGSLLINILLYLGMSSNANSFQQKNIEVSEEQLLSTALVTKEKQNLSQEMLAINKEEAIDTSDDITKRNDPLGTMGRLYIPDASLNVGLYYANLDLDDNYNAQTIVDNQDSAAYFIMGNKSVIADHNYQGFNRLINLNVGAQAYIRTGDSTVINYQLNNRLIGKNTTLDLVDSVGNSIQTMNGSLIIYTCYTSNEDVIITVWNQLN